MDKLIKLQSADKHLLEEIINNFGDDERAKREQGYYVETLQDIEELYSDMKKRHRQILVAAYTDKNPEGMKCEYMDSNGFSNIKTYYQENHQKIETEMKSRFPEPESSVKPDINQTMNMTREFSSMAIKLPKITLDKFDGDYQKWPSFYDLFRSLVHSNESLPAVQKLQYLKLHLTGEPEQLLRPFQVTENNYLAAWNTLKERYDNKRVLVNTQLRLLLTQNSVSQESSSTIRKLLDTTSECLQALSNLRINIEGWDPIIVYLIVQKLPAETHQLWEQSISAERELPSWKELESFLATRFRTLEAISTKSQSSNHDRRNQYQKPSTSNRSINFHMTHSSTCFQCQGPHYVGKCATFINQDTKQRLDITKSKGACLNCLRTGHRYINCPSKHKCNICSKAHHTLLHLDQRRTRAADPQLSSTAPSFTPRAATNNNIQTYMVDKVPYQQQQHQQVLLATTLIKVRSGNSGKEKIVKALIDPGSQTSFITDSTVKFLSLPRESASASIHGLGQNHIAQVKARTKFIIRAVNSDNEIEVEGLVLPQLTNVLPNRRVPFTKWRHLEHLQLADPQYHTPSKIDVLLGADVYANIILEGLRKGPAGSPMAQNTIFGWVLSGEIQHSQHSEQPVNTINNFHLNTDLDLQLRRFWELEEVANTKYLTKEEEECEQHFCNTHQRLADGSYEVELPLCDNSESVVLGRSRHIAVSRLFALERQFKKDEKFKENYIKCLQEYIDLGHMERVSPKDENSILQTSQNVSATTCYLPHHGIVKETSSTTKLRVVFDASRPTNSGVSLNDKMLRGPVIQGDLISLLLRWRKHRIAVTADLEKMYRQIKVRSSDAELQRIVWRTNTEAPIQDYKLTTVTFGTKSAPYIATRVLKQLALDEQKTYPIGSSIALQDFYVDDLLSGADSIAEARELQSQLTGLMESGRFHLRKWGSNADEILQSVPEEQREIHFPLHLHQEESIRTLGVKWTPNEDTFSYTIQLDSKAPDKWTKRAVLSEVTRLFDPLGWLAPYIILAKILLQRLWLAGTAWDDEVTPDTLQDWKKYRESMKEIKHIQIPRWLHYSNKNKSIEIHGFSDASIKAYAAVVYMCTTDDAGKRSVTMITAKSKVAPIKTISLPRLELSGALLLAKLIRHVWEALKITDPITTYAWTDSEIVLAWLQGHPSKWACFVGNRVSEIHQILGQNIWSHVVSKENPADCASRGMYPAELQNHILWWNGPEWLSKHKQNWPKSKVIKNIDLEIRKSITLHQVLTSVEAEKSTFVDELEGKYSNLTKLLRITAYMKRFINNISPGHNKISTKYLNADEIHKAMKMWIKIIQRKNFSNEINALTNNKHIDQRSRLIKLNPFIDEEKILRVGGRLQNANVNYEFKHPIILPDKGHFVNLLLTKMHKDTLHGGTQLMMAALGDKYWIINARNTIRHHIHKCVTCYRHRAVPQQQFMGNLPKSRVTINRPFSHTGIDYCGPFELKAHKGRNPKRYKSYVALFVCMAVKAIHLELVTELSAEGFIAAYRRFCSRRGKCTEIYCDNGTNFVAASKHLNNQHKQAIEQVNTDIAKLLENEGVRFNFIPPGSPHFGGLWEAGVRSTKYHLKRILGNATLTYEEFSTVLTQIEACLNSRPLCEISNDPQDLTALTPAHFLIGDVLVTPPEPSLLDINVHRLDRWQHLQNLYQNFWKRWCSEYLTRLQQRPKWTKKIDNIKVGDLVLIKEENLPPSRWLLARIIETHPGSDGLVRVVTLRIKSGTLKRPIAKVCLLPMETEPEVIKPDSTN